MILLGVVGLVALGALLAFGVLGARRAVAAPPAAASGPALSDADFQRFLDWREAAKLPAILLEPAGRAAPEAGGSRYGGMVWLPAGEAWPVGRDGQPLGFLAQLDFARLPPIADFPRSGVLQFFIGRNDHYGADFDHPEAGDYKVIWRERLDGPGRLHRAPPVAGGGEDFSPLYAAAARDGVALAGRAARQAPDAGDWTFHRDLGALIERDPTERIFSAIDREKELLPDFSHVGGHPGFTQSDYREAAPYRDVDRVLLQLWSDDTTLMWGDSGQGQFTIRRADLLKRDFGKALYQWDCY